MKLLFCPRCGDVRKLHRDRTVCECLASWGRYINDLDAVVGGSAIPLGISNPSFLAAIKGRPDEAPGATFEAWVIPHHSKTVTYEKPT